MFDVSSQNDVLTAGARCRICAIDRAGTSTELDDLRHCRSEMWVRELLGISDVGNEVRRSHEYRRVEEVLESIGARNAAQKQRGLTLTLWTIA